MRGAPAVAVAARRVERIIPAYAGSTSQILQYFIVDEDHPRVCGEHRCVYLMATLTMGSSPRMRGAPVCVSYGYFDHGIIPAYAGSTCAAPGACSPRRDHPRVCGEHVGSLVV